MSLSELDYEEPAASQLDRTPPQDVPAEQSVLGAMLLSKDAISDVSEILKGIDFYQPKHELIFDAILELYSRGEPADAITVASALTKKHPASMWGGPIYLTDLLASVSIASNATYYAEIVAEKATLRRLLEAAIKVSQMALQGHGDAHDIVDAAQQAIYNVSSGNTSEDYKPLTELMQPTIDEIELLSQHQGEMSGVPTGFAELDELTHGLHGGQMIIIAARPAVGKSTLGLDICRSASIKHGLTSAIFSLEMSQSEIVTRLLSAEASINFSNLRKGNLNDSDWQKIADVTSRVSQAPLFIDDSPNLTMMEIRAKARRLKQTNDLRLVVIDYLQLMSSGKKVESRQLEVSEFSRQIKLLAKELDIPVIAIAQLNRGPEQRQGGKPMMSDLRESGSLEQDADIVILLHREDLYDKTLTAGDADFIVAKNRGGRTDTLQVGFQGHYSRFTDQGPQSAG